MNCPALWPGKKGEIEAPIFIFSLSFAFIPMSWDFRSLRPAKGGTPPFGQREELLRLRHCEHSEAICLMGDRSLRTSR
jgi:hypothetical protein